MLSCVDMICGILGQVWYLIVLIPDLCHLSYLILFPIRIHGRNMQGLIILNFAITLKHQTENPSISVNTKIWVTNFFPFSA